MQLLRHLVVTIAVAFLVAATGCGGESSGGGDDTTIGGNDTAADTVQVDTPEQEDTEPAEDTILADAPSVVMLMPYSMDTDVEASPGGSYPVQVVAYTESYEAIEGLQISFSLEQTEGTGGDASLSAETLITDEYGVAEVTFAAGSMSDVVYTLTASATNADDLVFTISMVALPTGSMKVTWTYEGDKPVETIDLLVLHQVVLCIEYLPIEEPQGASWSATLPLVDGEVVIDELDALPGYTIIARGFDADGELVASGCTDMVTVHDGLEAQVELAIEPLALLFDGTYDLEYSFDLSGAVPSGLGGLYDAFADAFDPATYPDAFKETLHSWVMDEFYPYKDELPDNCLEVWDLSLDPLLASHIGALDDSWAFLQDAPAIIEAAFATVTITGSWEAETFDQATHEFTGTATVQGIVVGDVSYPLSELEEAVYPQDGFLEWQISFTVSPLGEMAFSDQEVPLFLGRLAMTYLLTEELPAVFGTQVLEEAALVWFDCASMVPNLDPRFYDGLEEGIPGCKPFPDEMVEGCQATVESSLTPVLSYINQQLNVGTVLRIEGGAGLVDADQDLIIDEIDGGALTGTVYIDESPGDEFAGTIEVSHQ